MMGTETETKLKDGVYKSTTATYFIKDGKIIMKLNGEFFKTTSNFMVGADFKEALPEGISNDFDQAYEQCKNW